MEHQEKIERAIEALKRHLPIVRPGNKARDSDIEFFYLDRYMHLKFHHGGKVDLRCLLSSADKMKRILFPKLERPFKPGDTKKIVNVLNHRLPDCALARIEQGYVYITYILTDNSLLIPVQLLDNLARVQKKLMQPSNSYWQ